MYFIYLYTNRCHERTSSQYGYYTGRHYTVNYEKFPECETEISRYKRKAYKYLKSAIRCGEIAMNKFFYVTYFDVDDENGNTVYTNFDGYKKEEKNMKLNTVDKETNQHIFFQEKEDQKSLKDLVENLIHDLQNKTDGRHMNDLEYGRYSALKEVLEIIEDME